MAAYEDFAADPLARQVWLWEFQPRDPSGNLVTLRYGTETWPTTSADTPSGAVYAGRVAEGINLQSRQFPPRTTTLGAVEPGGEVRLLQTAGELDQYSTVNGYVWDGAPARCLHGGYSPALGRRLLVSEFQEVWSGSAERFESGVLEATVKLRSRDAAFRSPFEARRHRGNTWCLDMGASSYISFGAAGIPAAVDLRTDFSCDFVTWFDSGGMGSIRRLAGWDHSATTYPWQIRVNTSNQLVFRDSAATVLSTSAFAFTANRRYWVGVRVGAGLLRMMFLDLVTMTETVETFSVSTSARPAPDGLFRVGHASAGHDGTLEQLRIWSVAKTAEQMRQLRLRPMTAAELAASNLEMALLLDDGSSTTCVDSAPGGTNGTTNGTVAWNATLEGGAQLAGRPKINSLGAPPNMEPRFVGLSGSSLQRTYQVHADLIKAGTLVVYEGGAPTTATLGTAYTDWKSFIAGATLSTKYDVLRHRGGSFVRLFTNPTLPISIGLEGDAADGTHRVKAADLAVYVATTRGDTPLDSGTEIDTARWATLATAAPGINGYVVTDEATVGKVIGDILHGVGINAWMNRQGLFTGDQLSLPTDANPARLNEKDIISIRPIPADIPISRATVLHHRNYVVLRDDQVNLGATTAQRIAAQQEWQRASYRDATVADLHPLSEELVVESYLVDLNDGLTEAARLLELHGTDQQMYEIVARIALPDLEPLDEVEASLTLQSIAGTPLARLNWPHTFIVLEWANSGTDNSMTLLVWG